MRMEPAEGDVRREAMISYRVGDNDGAPSRSARRWPRSSTSWSAPSATAGLRSPTAGRACGYWRSWRRRRPASPPVGRPCPCPTGPVGATGSQRTRTPRSGREGLPGPDHRRRGPHRLHDRRPARRPRCRRETWCSTTSAVVASPTSPRPRPGPVTVVEGDIRDRKLLRGLLEVVDVLFHQAALRITQCAAEPPLGRRGAGRRHVSTSSRPPVEAGVPRARWRRRRHRSTASPTSSPPPRPSTRTTTAPSRAAKVFNGGSARSFHEMYGSTTWRALRHRLRAPHGHPRRLHRGPGATGWSASPRGSRR